MTIYKVSKHTHEGSIDSVPKGNDIGTDGCTMCVGVIVVETDGGQHCAHIDNGLSNVNREAAERQVELKAAGILADLPPKAKADKVGYCTTSKAADAVAIIRQLKARYGEKVTVEGNCNGICTQKGGIVLLKGADSLDPAVPVPDQSNKRAEIR